VSEEAFTFVEEFKGHCSILFPVFDEASNGAAVMWRAQRIMGAMFEGEKLLQDASLGRVYPAKQ
jgi:hypothetical protein